MVPSLCSRSAALEHQVLRGRAALPSNCQQRRRRWRGTRRRGEHRQGRSLGVGRSVGLGGRGGLPSRGTGLADYSVQLLALGGVGLPSASRSLSGGGHKIGSAGLNGARGFSVLCRQRRRRRQPPRPRRWGRPPARARGAGGGGGGGLGRRHGTICSCGNLALEFKPKRLQMTAVTTITKVMTAFSPITIHACNMHTY